MNFIPFIGEMYDFACEKLFLFVAGLQMSTCLLWKCILYLSAANKQTVFQQVLAFAMFMNTLWTIVVISNVAFLDEQLAFSSFRGSDCDNGICFCGTVRLALRNSFERGAGWAAGGGEDKINKAYWYILENCQLTFCVLDSHLSQRPTR